jgi:hypothetical protein
MSQISKLYFISMRGASGPYCIRGVEVVDREIQMSQENGINISSSARFIYDFSDICLLYYSFQTAKTLCSVSGPVWKRSTEWGGSTGVSS